MSLFYSAAKALAFAACFVLTAPHVGVAQYPSRPIHVVVPFAPGGGTDILARIIGQKMTENWGQPVLIENRPGASGGIGATVAARATPDGYTLLMASTGALMAMAGVAASPSPAFDVRRDLAPVTLVA